MHMHIIMTIMMLSAVSLFTFSQEEPATSEQIEESTSPAEGEDMPAEEASSEAVASEDTPAEENTEESQEETAAPTEDNQESPSEEQTPEATTEPTAEESPSVEETETSVEESVQELPPIPKLEEEEILIPEEPTEPEEPVGIDTVSLENPQGNWLFKRIWWERAEERYDKIRQLVDAIWESRVKFFEERNNLDKNVLNPFYINIGIDQGELQIILSELNEFLEKERAEGELSEQERMLHETYSAEAERLQQLKADVEAVSTLDNSIDEALGKFMEQINRVRNYEAQAWDNFKEIAHILNDKKARELYYMIEGAARNIKTISVYLEQQFSSHFDTLIGETTKRVKRVQDQIESLKEKGISFKRQAELLEEKEQQSEEEDEEEEVAPKPKLGWFEWIGSLFSDAFGYVFSIIRMPYDMIFGK